MIVLRRREGRNWVRMEELHRCRSGPSETSCAIFSITAIMLENNSDEELLAMRPSLPRHGEA